MRHRIPRGSQVPFVIAVFAGAACLPSTPVGPLEGGGGATTGGPSGGGGGATTGTPSGGGTAGFTNPPFGLPVLDHLKLRLDATTLGLADDEPVWSWPDASGNGFDVSVPPYACWCDDCAPVAISPPLYVADGVNGRPAVRWNGSKDGLQTGVDFGMVGDPEFTVLLAGRIFSHRDAESPFPVLWSWGDSTVKGRFGGLSMMKGRPIFVTGDDANAVVNPSGFEQFIQDPLDVKPVIVTVRKTSGLIQEHVQIYYNGVRQALIEGPENLVPNYPGSRFVLNRCQPAQSATNLGELDIAELLVYDAALSENERKRVECHLAHKYQIDPLTTCSSCLPKCEGQTCKDGMCIGVCASDQVRCDANAPQTCDANGQWQGDTSCENQTCKDAICIGECEAKETRCVGNVPQRCHESGKWEAQPICVNQTCKDGVCVGACAPGQTECSGTVPNTCDANGGWQAGVACDGPGQLCSGGDCLPVPPSCDGLEPSCGPSRDESCCMSPVVPGGMFNRFNLSLYPATISGFRMDRFEVTVGRFRKFVEAYSADPGSKPAAGAGAHPSHPGSGWSADWDSHLPDLVTLKQDLKCPGEYSWTDDPGANELLPMNCLTWYMAFAFCAWDGGRLPTEAESNYATAGGNEQRLFPWGLTVPDPTYAVYDCTADGVEECAATDILPVGSTSKKGDGRWSQADLSGSVWEWSLDRYVATSSVPKPCNDCAKLNAGSARTARAASWANSAPYLATDVRASAPPETRHPELGVRCARGLGGT